ncbi:MAG: phospholipid carrier-dependent glycosyltransferase [Anaerolineales bacterium]|nr:phospholipid carrier-dependent glycosyltransferase [Anaerolineales bacterium]
MALITLPRVLELGAFVAFDEPLYWPWSNQFFQALQNGDWAGTIVGRGHPGIMVLLIQCLGLAARYGWAVLTGLPSPQALTQLHLDQETIVFFDLAARRLPMALCNVLLLLGLLWLVQRQFGRNVALVATILLALDPFLLSDSRTLRGDALMATLMTSSAICMLVYLTEYRWRYLFLSGAAMGLALANKTSTVAILPFIGLVILAFALWRVRQDRWTAGVGWGLMSGLAWSGTAVAVFWAVWPALWVTPGPALAWMFHFAFDTSFDGGRLNYFMGQLSTEDPFPLFYLVTIPLRLSPLVMIGLMVSVVEITFAGQRRTLITQLKTWFNCQTPPFFKPNPTLTALGLSLYALSIWFVITVGYLKRDHYALPLFPALDILGAIGLVRLAAVLIKKWVTHHAQFLSQPRWGLYCWFKRQYRCPIIRIITHISTR